MPKIYDEQVDFTTTSVSSNQKDAASIQPIQGGENLWENVLNRTPENLRTRSEALRGVVEDLKYFADYDRALLLSASSTTFTCTNQTDGYVLSMTGGPLWVYPALTPGQLSGGRVRGARMFVQNGPAWVPYAGTLGANDLTFIATGQFTGQRGYAEADDMTGGEFTVGGNRLRISLVANPSAVGGPASISATVTGAPETLITVTYGTLTTSTTISELIAWVAADLNSQGTYGLAHMLRGVTTSAGTAPPPAITNALFQGGYDAEAHRITDFAPFFNDFDGSNYINRLQEGESLAMAFVSGPVEPGAGSTGGRRQALFDLPTDRVGGSADNTLSNLILFNTGREPEKIPGSIPIGKVIDGKFVFIDGTTVGTAPISLGESGVTLARLAAPTGAAMIGYDGSGNWNPDATVNPALVGLTVEAALDEIVTRLGGSGAGDSGARRIGAESLSGSASTGNRALSPTQGSVREVIDATLNALPTATTGGGVNFRVNEDGHELRGVAPINKDFTSLSLGARRFGAYLRNSGDLAATRPGSTNFADLVLTPITFGAGGGLNLGESVTSGSTNSRLRLNDGTIAARFASIWPSLPTMISANLFNGADTAVIPLIFVRVQGLVSPTGAENGFYIFDRFTSNAGATLGEFILRKLDYSLADFSAVTDYSAATVDFLSGVYTGGTPSNTQLGFHQLPGNYAGIVVGSASNVTPWLEVLTNDTPGFTPTSGQAVKKGAVFCGDRARWRVGAVDERHTDNILVSGDKALLDGVETSTPVDATANHHHGSAYTAVRFRSSAYSYPQVLDLSLGAPWFFETPNDAPSGYAKHAVLIYYRCLITVDGGAPGTDLVGLALEFAGSALLTTYRAGAVQTRMTKDAVGTTTLVLEGQLLVPIYFDPSVNFPTGASGFRVKVQAGSLGAGVDATLSTLDIDEIGYVLVRV